MSTAPSQTPAQSQAAALSTPKRDRPEVSDGRQYVEEKGSEKIVKNSPYGAKRQHYGWGSPFAKPLKAQSTKYPNVLIGCSSLNGTPNPGKDRSMDKSLQQYQKKFRCLEHCAPYHKMGDPEQYEKWAGMVAKGFTYTVKCNQFLTHVKQLEVDVDTTAHIKNFFEERLPKLGATFGAALVQLPPQFRFSQEHLQRLRSVAELTPSNQRIAVEFRHSSWYNDETYAVLRTAKWALVATHVPEVGDSPVLDTGCGFMYIRLHGAVEMYCGDYGIPLMRKWANVIKRFVAANGSSAPVFVFLNNNETHVGGLTSSVVDATALAECLDLDDDPVVPAVTVQPAPAAAPQQSPTHAKASTPKPTPPATTAAGDETEDEVIEVE